MRASLRVARERVTSNELKSIAIKDDSSGYSDGPDYRSVEKRASKAETAIFGKSNEPFCGSNFRDITRNCRGLTAATLASAARTDRLDQ